MLNTLYILDIMTLDKYFFTSAQLRGNDKLFLLCDFHGNRGLNVFSPAKNLKKNSSVSTLRVKYVTIELLSY